MLKRFGLTPVMRRDRALEWQAVTAEMITRSLPLVAWWFPRTEYPLGFRRVRSERPKQHDTCPVRSAPDDSRRAFEYFEVFANAFGCSKTLPCA